MDKKFIINIGRQLGSGGRSIADMLAHHYGITAYDRKLIELAAKESGLSQEFFENADEKKWHGFFHSIFSNRAAANALGSNDSYLSNDALFKVQSDIIRDLAERESCIFIGRCADYILEDYKPFNIFVYADMESRMERCRAKGGKDASLSDKELAKKIQSIDKARAQYYRFYSGRSWGDKSNYDLCINTSGRSIEKLAKAVAYTITNASEK